MDKKNSLWFHLSKDLSAGRKTECSFSTQFLSNPFIYQKKYQILEPLRKVGLFNSTDARKSFYRALLDNCPYTRTCPYCDGNFKDLLHHQLFSCHRLNKERAILLSKFDKLKGSKLPDIQFTYKHQIMSVALTNKKILNAYTSFLKTAKNWFFPFCLCKLGRVWWKLKTTPLKSYQTKNS